MGVIEDIEKLKEERAWLKMNDRLEDLPRCGDNSENDYARQLLGKFNELLDEAKRLGRVERLDINGKLEQIHDELQGQAYMLILLTIMIILVWFTVILK